MSLQNSYDVIVAGGGPVGLLLAGELRRYGVRVIVIERLADPSRQIKAGSAGSQSAEIFDQRGLLDEFPRPDMSIFASVSDPSAPPAPVGHIAGLWLLRGAPDIRTMPIFAAQYEIEVVLNRYVTGLGVPILRDQDVIGLTDTGVTLSDGTELTGTYVVGCDGGRSTVRSLAGFDFPGTEPTVTGRQAVVDIAEPNPLVKGWHRTERGMLVYGPSAQRILTVEFDGPPADRSTPITGDEIEASLRRVSGTDVTVTAFHTGTRWTDNTRQATDYRRDRILLAGDAAHIHPPFGGQGLNLGFQDAANLGWKLAATIAGWAPEGLLDTYTAERHPVAEAALANTRAQVALMRPDPQSGALRTLVADLLAYDDANQDVSRMMAGVNRPYDVGSAHPEAGRIVADRPIGAQRLYELLRTPGGLLLDGSSDASWSKQATPWADRVQIVQAEGDSLLIRPDGIVAWGDGDDSLTDALTRWFGKSS